jgi:hypothetical protein
VASKLEEVVEAPSEPPYHVEILMLVGLLHDGDEVHPFGREPGPRVGRDPLRDDPRPD